MAIQQIEKARLLLDRATSVSEVRVILDVAEAARIYAKRAHCSMEVINHAVRIKLDAERKAGGLLAKMEKDRGGGDVKSGDHRSRKATGVRLADIGVTKSQSSRWQLMAAIPEKVFAKTVDETAAKGKELTSGFFQKLALRFRPKNGAVAVTRRQSTTGFVNDLDDLAGQRFGCIYADPPWPYTNQASRGATGNHYSTMSISDLRALPIANLAAKQSHLHLWATSSFLFEARSILDAWGFEFKGTFVWVKPQMGMGNYWRNAHEILLLGVKGDQPALSKREISWIEYPRGLHSEKPEAIRQRIARLSPGPFLELFGRRPIRGWTVYGNQQLARR